MPNHITNSVTIKHDDPKKIAWLRGCFKKKQDGENEGEDSQTLDFNLIIPQPDNIFRGNLGLKEKELCEKEGRPNWYDWNVENWGTKWGAYDGEILGESAEAISCTFLTAWSPPEPIFDRLEELGFEVNGWWLDEGDFTPNEIGNGSHSEFFPSVSLEYAG